MATRVSVPAERTGSTAIVSIAALDLRRRPNHRAELRSQLLLGEVVRCLASDRTRHWVRVENQADRYRGWVRSWGLIPNTDHESAAWLESAQLTVVVHHAEVRERPGGKRLLSPVFLNTRLSPVGGRARPGWRQVRLPDTRRGWIAANAVRGRRFRSPRLDRHVQAFLGVPYLWGGRTPLGFDCSGFVQQLLAARDVRIPRDANDQYLATRRLPPRDRGRPGDLIFFGARRGAMTHVGIQLGSSLFAHARGWVRINSTDPGNPLYDNTLMSSFRARGRLVLGWAAD